MVLPPYKIILTPEAKKEIDDVYKYIAFERSSPITAERYVDGILGSIYSLALNGSIYAINYNDRLQRQYGPNVRTVVYKKMTIIYTVMDNFVIVHRVVAGSLII